MAMSANKLSLLYYNSRPDIVLPAIDSGWYSPDNTAWVQPVYEPFRLRINTARLAPSDVISTAFRLQYELNLGVWSYINDSSSVLQLTTSAFYDDLDDCLDKILTDAGTLLGAPNGQYKCMPVVVDAKTGLFTWPNQNGRRMETEWSLKLIPEDLNPDIVNEIDFRHVRADGEVYSEPAFNIPTLFASFVMSAPDGAGFMGPATGGAGYCGAVAGGAAHLGAYSDGAGALGSYADGAGYLGPATDGAGAIKRKDN